MSKDDLSNLRKLETTWKQGFTIVASRIGEWLRTNGVDCSFEIVDVPAGTRINHLRTDFRRRWERLPVEWKLPEIGEKIGFKVDEYIDSRTGEMKDVIAEKSLLPWAINDISLDDEFRIEAYTLNPVRGSMAAEWLEENVKRCLDDEYRWWVGFFQHFMAKLEKELLEQIEPGSNGKRWIWIGDDMRVRRHGVSESIDLGTLSPPLRSIAQSLIDRPGNVVEDINLQSPDSETDLEPGTIRSYISRLRTLLEPLGIKIERVRGTGYRISL